MARDTLLGFPLHSLPYRYRNSYHFIDSLKPPLRRGLFIPRIKKIPVGVGVLDDPSVPLLQPKRRGRCLHRPASAALLIKNPVIAHRCGDP